MNWYGWISSTLMEVARTVPHYASDHPEECRPGVHWMAQHFDAVHTYDKSGRETPARSAE